jgi:hypothetical protein
VANTLNLFRNGAVGFIDWLGGLAWLTHRQPCQNSTDRRDSDIGRKNQEGTKQARRSAEGITIIGHLAADGINDTKQTHRGGNKATDKEKQPQNTGNNLRSTHPSNEKEVSYRHRERAVLEVKGG